MQASLGEQKSWSAQLALVLPLLVVGVMVSPGCSRSESTAPTPDAAAQAASIALPAPALTAVEQQGEELYGRICAVCHGAAGEGYKADRAPALNRADFLSGVNDAFLRRAIAEGRQGSTMSAWGIERGGPLSPAQVNAVVAFLRTWHRQPHAVFDEQPLHGSAEQGAVIFLRDCARCHGVAGRGGDYEQIGNPQLLAGVSTGFLRAVIRDGRPGTPMPGFAATLDAQAIEDVVSYLRSLQPLSPPEAAMPRATAPPLPLGPVPLNPKGPEALGFNTYPEGTPGEVVHQQLERHARIAILDARAPSDYMNEHIAGAVSVPFYDPSPYFDALPKDAWLVCYCGCPSAESGALAKKLQEHGFKNVTVLAEGFGFWKTKNYATQKGDKP